MKSLHPIPRHSRLRCSRQGFTLVELLVSMAVLALLVIMIGQLINTTSLSIRLSNQISNTDSDARTAFGCIGRDVKNMVRRGDVDFIAGNPSARIVGGQSGFVLLFLTRAASAGSPNGGNRNISLVGYEIAPSSANSYPTLPCLLRSGRAIGWSDNGFMGLNTKGLPVKFGDVGFPSDLLPQTSDFDVLASSVVRVVIGFQLTPDDLPVTLEDGSSVTDGSGGSNSRGQWVYSPPVRTLTPLDGSAPVRYVDLSRVSSIVVGLVVLDRATLPLLNASQVNLISNAFIVPQQNQLPLRAWTPALNSIGTALPRVPLPALQSLRTYQCVYPLSPE